MLNPEEEEDGAVAIHSELFDEDYDNVGFDEEFAESDDNSEMAERFGYR